MEGGAIYMKVIQAILKIIDIIMVSFDPCHNDEYSKKHDYRIDMTQWITNKNGTITHV
jgi:hypothetical protein